MPELAPVTRATRPLRSNIAVFLVSEVNVISALQPKHLARIVGRRYLEVQRFEDGAHAAALSSIRLRPPAWPQPQGILTAPTHIGAHAGSHGSPRNLGTASTQEGPPTPRAEQTVRRAR